MIPSTPTIIYCLEEDVFSVFDLESFFAQEMMVRLKRRKERRMSRCFNWFPFWWIRRTQYIPRFGGVLQECGDRVEIVSI